MEKGTFYREWLPLPKAEFNVLTMIAEQGGTFTGNWSEMCRYINLTRIATGKFFRLRLNL